MDEDSGSPPPARRDLRWVVLFPLVLAGHFVLGTLAWIIVWLVAR